MRYFLFIGTVPMRYFLFIGNVPMNNLFLNLMPNGDSVRNKGHLLTITWPTIILEDVALLARRGSVSLVVVLYTLLDK